VKSLSRMVLFPCPESRIRVQNLHFWVSIVRFNLVCNFLSWLPLPP
jgi:hypothetical protein